MNTFPHYLQLDAMDCGPTCLRMIARYYGKNYSLQTLRERSFITREGVSMLGISDAAESIGFRTSGVRITLKQLEEDVERHSPWNRRPNSMNGKTKRRRTAGTASPSSSSTCCPIKDKSLTYFWGCWL